MGRLFAPLFGAVAFLVVLLRSLAEGWAVEPTLEKACLALVSFSLLGGWVGWTADAALRQEVQTKLAALAGQTPSAQTQPQITEA